MSAFRVLARKIRPLPLCSNYRTKSNVLLDSFDDTLFTKSMRQFPGHVSSHRWMKQRDENADVERRIFQTGQSMVSASGGYYSSRSHASVSGRPVDDQFSYPVHDKLNDLPNLDFKLRANLELMGLDQLTPIQSHSLGLLAVDDDSDDQQPDKTCGVVGRYDLMAAAQTGSGKTLAYLIPMFNRLMRVYPFEAMQSISEHRCQYPSGLILVPTRELVQQILVEACKLAYRTFVRPIGLYGGVKPIRQVAEVNKGCHVVIATPGRLIDFLRQDLLRLNHCRTLVLDEADRMLDMGFEQQIRTITDNPKFGMPCPSNRRCDNNTTDNQRQTSLFSATFPREVALLAKDFLRGSRCISLSLTDSSGQSGAIVPSWGRVGGSRDAEQPSQLARIVPEEIVQQFLFVDPPTQLVERLVGVIEDIIGGDRTTDDDSSTESRSSSKPSRVLVFCNTKSQVDRIDSVLYRRGLRSAAIHGDKSQDHRSQALDYFRRGTVNILVASSVAARGLDIPHVAAVINIGLPIELDDYVHRIGRTGRMGRRGMAVTLLSSELLRESRSEVARDLVQLVQASNSTDVELPSQLTDLARLAPSGSKYGSRWSPSSSRSSSRSQSFNRQRRHSSSELDSRYATKRW